MHEHDFTDVQSRLVKIEGHIRGIRKMMDEGKSCNDLLIQFSAVQKALSRAAKGVLDEHLEHCIRDKAESPEQRQEIDDFKLALDRFLK